MKRPTQLFAMRSTSGLQLEFAEASWTRALILHARGRLDEAAADAQAALERRR